MCNLTVSKGDAYIYYDLDGIDVARVLVPAGLSIIMTTDIYSGLIIKNPHGLSHRSESEHESHRQLLHLVLEPKTGGMDMALSNEEWLGYFTVAATHIYESKLNRVKRSSA
jgi:hypothetical protein